MKKTIALLLCCWAVGGLALAAPEDDRTYLPEGEDVNGDLSYEEGGQYYVATPQEEVESAFIMAQPWGEEIRDYIQSGFQLCALAGLYAVMGLV